MNRFESAILAKKQELKSLKKNISFIEFFKKYLKERKLVLKRIRRIKQTIAFFKKLQKDFNKNGNYDKLIAEVYKDIFFEFEKSKINGIRYTHIENSKEYQKLINYFDTEDAYDVFYKICLDKSVDEGKKKEFLEKVYEFCTITNTSKIPPLTTEDDIRNFFASKVLIEEV